jgi:hypothetical protein
MAATRNAIQSATDHAITVELEPRLSCKIEAQTRNRPSNTFILKLLNCDDGNTLGSYFTSFLSIRDREAITLTTKSFHTFDISTNISTQTLMINSLLKHLEQEVDGQSFCSGREFQTNIPKTARRTVLTLFFLAACAGLVASIYFLVNEIGSQDAIREEMHRTPSTVLVGGYTNRKSCSDYIVFSRSRDTCDGMITNWKRNERGACYSLCDALGEGEKRIVGEVFGGIGSILVSIAACFGFALCDLSTNYNLFSGRKRFDDLSLIAFSIAFQSEANKLFKSLEKTTGIHLSLFSTVAETRAELYKVKQKIADAKSHGLLLEESKHPLSVPLLRR